MRTWLLAQISKLKLSETCAAQGLEVVWRERSMRSSAFLTRKEQRNNHSRALMVSFKDGGAATEHYLQFGRLVNMEIQKKSNFQNTQICSQASCQVTCQSQEAVAVYT